MQRIRAARRSAVAASMIMCCASNAFAARDNVKASVANRAADKPTAQSLKQAKPHAKASQSSHKTRRKAKAPRSHNVYYRWTAEQLMLGGVDPSQIGRDTNAADADSARRSAASVK
ncbi:hypothetical protein [Paraburkholderia sp. C35]|uniref:hypothetical protein n=1 Tax=Paraburkholderia sp. C35 TaxID=2126993 RepID=UPI000D68E09B|nr:hypothetical protein [Paraburkholderia sp. C35]